MKKLFLLLLLSLGLTTISYAGDYEWPDDVFEEENVNKALANLPNVE